MAEPPGSALNIFTPPSSRPSRAGQTEYDTMDPLSIMASVTGILTAAAKVASVLGAVKDAPNSISKVLIEVIHIKIVFSALQNFLDRTLRLAPQRAALIQLDDIVVILTQTVLVFSELETFVRPLLAHGRVSRWQQITWTWEQSGASRLVNQLQHHKTSLSLMLQIMQWCAVSQSL